MVGIPRSKGCRICVQRRVRCDLTRPTCNNCKKGNRPCPGYDSNLRIHDEGSKLRQRFAAAKEEVVPTTTVGSESPNATSSQSSGSSPEDSWELVTRFTTPDFDENALRPNDKWPNQLDAVFGFATGQGGTAFDILPIQPGNNEFPVSALSNLYDPDKAFLMALNGGVYSPYIAQEQLLDSFTNAIGGHGPGILPKQMRNHQNWLSQLPGLFGSRLLDTAVRAVSLIHLGRIQRSEELVQESRQFYGNALHLLNKALTDDKTGMSKETLSATVLLSFYEMFASNSNRSWVQHSGGAALLMRIRGPQRHLTGLDRDIYLAYRHTIIIDAFMRDEACFLAEPEWLDMAKKVHDDLQGSLSDARLDIYNLAEEFYLEHLQTPGTLKDSRSLDRARKQMTTEEFAVHVEMILARARMHRANLKSINLRLRAALSKQGLETAVVPTNDPVFPTQYVFPNVFVASTNTGHWTIMIILNLILKEIEKSVAPEKHALYLMENREMCREICRTTPFMLTSSFLGPFFCIFALRLCLMVFEPGPERAWVVRKLREIGQTHMRMASDIPVFDPERGFDEIPTQYPNDLARLEELA
jgi:hypothetical protein